MYEYTSSVIKLGPILTPHKIEIDDNSVTWSRNNGWSDLFLSRNSFKILKKNISGVFLNVDIIFGTTIIISSFGGANIIAKNFDDCEAKEIRDLLLN